MLLLPLLPLLLPVLLPPPVLLPLLPLLLPLPLPEPPPPLPPPAAPSAPPSSVLTMVEKSLEHWRVPSAWGTHASPCWQSSVTWQLAPCPPSAAGCEHAAAHAASSTAPPMPPRMALDLTWLSLR